MPEMRFTVQWPNGELESCYSPSLVVTEYMAPGESYPVADFLARSRAALTIGSERVKAKYGFACSSALDQLARIEAAASVFSDAPDARVTVMSFQT